VVPEWNRLKTVLRTLQQQTNELRDLDVLLLDFPALQAALPWDEGPRLASWETELRRRRRLEHRRVKAWLESEDYRFAATEIDRLFEDLSPLGEPWSVGELAASAFEKSGLSLKKSLKALGPACADGVLHEVRIQAKRLRYFLDGLGALGPPTAVRFLTAALKETQESLGLFQDRSILLERLKDERQAFRSERKPTPRQPDPLTFGILLGVLAAEQERRRAEARKDGRKLQSKDFLKALGRLAEPDPEAPHGP